MHASIGRESIHLLHQRGSGQAAQDARRKKLGERRAQAQKGKQARRAQRSSKGEGWRHRGPAAGADSTRILHMKGGRGAARAAPSRIAGWEGCSSQQC